MMYKLLEEIMDMLFFGILYNAASEKKQSTVIINNNKSTSK